MLNEASEIWILSLYTVAMLAFFPVQISKSIKHKTLSPLFFALANSYFSCFSFDIAKTHYDPPNR